MTEQNSPLTYQDAGVDIEAGNALVDCIKPYVKKTYVPGVLSHLGGFSGLFELDKSAYDQPVLVSATDGVGTKLKLAIDTGHHTTVGQDLVAMCVNDLLVCGAKPLFFLDYYACGALSVDQASDVIKGIAEGCELAECALIGGETAEMPGMYQAGDYDLAGFAVGIVDKALIKDPSHVQPGDVLLGLPSSGCHSNGFSLIRKIIERGGHDLAQPFGDSTLAQTLLTPTTIYVSELKDLLPVPSLKALCHITGGGFTENLPRILPDNCQAKLQVDSWLMPEIFHWLQSEGNISAEEMYRTFNCGIGMVLCVDKEAVNEYTSHFAANNTPFYTIGEITERGDGEPAVQLTGLP